MVYVVDEPAVYNADRPESEMVGCDEAVAHHYHNNLSDEDRAIHKTRGRYVSSEFKKFKWTSAPVDPVIFSKHLEIAGKFKNLKHMFATGESFFIITPEFKALIEAYEPDTHDIWPIRLTSERQGDYPGDYFGLRICQFLTCFRPEETDPVAFVDTVIANRYTPLLETKSKLIAMSRKAMGSAHLWREEGFLSKEVCISDVLQAAVKEAGLKMPKVFKLREIE